MITLDFGGGLLLGLASSLHCAGMCGGIAASIALAISPGTETGDRLIALLQAQAGKATGYPPAGAALGWAGAGLYGALDMAEAFKTWQCRTCGYIYEEEAGDPPEGLAPGTRWADIPADWICPLCGTPKSDFDMIEF